MQNLQIYLFHLLYKQEYINANYLLKENYLKKPNINQQIIIIFPQTSVNTVRYLFLKTTINSRTDCSIKLWLNGYNDLFARLLTQYT